MEQLTRAFDTVLDLLLRFGAFCMVFLARADAFARARMTELGWTPGVQTMVEVVSAAVLVLVLLRVLAPVLRLLLILLLLVLALQLLPSARVRHAAGTEAPPWTAAA